MYKHMLPWLGRGLLTSNGQKWHLRRKIITPTFHFSILQGFVDVFNRNTEIMIKQLDKVADQPNVDLCPYITCCTLDNVCGKTLLISVNLVLIFFVASGPWVYQLGSCPAYKWIGTQLQLPRNKCWSSLVFYELYCITLKNWASLQSLFKNGQYLFRYRNLPQTISCMVMILNFDIPIKTRTKDYDMHYLADIFLL